MGNILSSLSGTATSAQSDKRSETSKAPQGSGAPAAASSAPSTLLPAANPTRSFWLVPPAPIAAHVSGDTVPARADVVVIGSGITAASFARTLLDYDRDHERGEHGARPISVVMLEARETCSGATGRNGGHINPPLYHDYAALKARFGARTAQQIVRFRLAHLEAVRAALADEDAGLARRAQFRDVESVDVFFARATFERAKTLLGVYRADMPREGARYAVYERAEAVQKFGLSPLAVGCIATRAGAVHPYRLVTGILARLLEDYPGRFTLYTRTPCTSITGPSAPDHRYTVHTPRGAISTTHVVHATNAYAAGLLPGLARARAIRPLRETMSAQRAGTGSALHAGALLRGGARSFVFFDERRAGFDYLTQLPGPGWGGEGERGEGESGDEGGGGGAEKGERESEGGKGGVKRKGGELMFGAGFDAGAGGLDGLGSADDSAYSTRSAAHVSGALPVYFGEANWGAEALPGLSESESDADEEDGGSRQSGGAHEEEGRKPRSKPEGKKKKARWHEGRVKALWSGILSMSADGLPWVGRLPPAITGRAAGPLSTAGAPAHDGDDRQPENEKHSPPSDAEKQQQQDTSVTSPGGEWIAAGYSGEGMVYAWESARALAYMVLGVAEAERVREWLPGVFRASEARLGGLVAESGSGTHQVREGGERGGRGVWLIGKNGVYAQEGAASG